jgi:hypothetical protein
MATEAGTKCRVCGLTTMSTLAGHNSEFCYRHYQIFDSLKNEFAARHASLADGKISWRDFLVQKKQENPDPDIQKVIETELNWK